jgi:hypothetical protein
METASLAAVEGRCVWGAVIPALPFKTCEGSPWLSALEDTATQAAAAALDDIAAARTKRTHGVIGIGLPH